MPTNPEALRLNLEYYRKQAKALLKAARAADSAALARLAPRSPKAPQALALHDAQFAIAREQGFPSWPRFRAFLHQSALDFQGLVAAFVDAALTERRSAEEILARHPAIAAAGLHPALVLGDVKRVAQALDEMPGTVKEKSGPQQWEPLLYVCFSTFAQGQSDRTGDLAETARLLLRAGANPDAVYYPKEWPDNPLSCLYAASGQNNNPALTRVLLEAGANPNDHESLYHSTEHPDLVCFKLLLEHGAKTEGSNALKHMLDREDLEGVRILLAAGADPNETNYRGETALHWAVWRRRGPEIIAALVDGGVNLDAPRTDGRTAYAMAAESGQMETASLLASRGASLDLSPLDRFVAACAAAGPEELERLLADPPQGARSPETDRLLPDIAATGGVAGIRALLAAGIPIDTRGDHGGTALHWACWHGFADVVDVLLLHGASLTIEDLEYQGTPAGWFCHGLQNCGDRSGDYPKAARLLLAAGAAIPAPDLPTGVPEIDAIFREHGLIE